MGAQALGGEFAAAQPGVGADHAVVAEHVDARQADGDLARRLGAGVFVVHGCDDELQTAADEQARHEQDAPVAEAHDDEGVCDEGEDGNGGEDVGHGEGVGDFSHLEEICFESLGVLVGVSCEGRGRVTDDEHGA